MVDWNHAYLLASLLYLALWLVLFLAAAPFLRVVMLVGGVLFCWLGPLGQQLWFLRDWWQPPGIFTAWPWLADLILTFSHIGIVVAVYPVVCRRTLGLSPFTTSLAQCFQALLRLAPMLALSLVVMLIAEQVTVWHSSVTVCLAMLAGGLYVIGRRSDLLPAAAVSAVLMVFVTWPVFWIMHGLSPGWVDAIWCPGLFSRWRLVGMPLGDMVFYASSGFQCGGLVAYLFAARWRSTAQSVWP